MLGAPSVVKSEYNAENNMTTIYMMIALICCETGEKIEVPWIGQGADKGDKGCYKAITGGYKTFLMKMFMIPTGDDPENWSPELEEESKKSSQQEKPNQTKTIRRYNIRRIKWQQCTTMKREVYFCKCKKNRNDSNDRQPNFTGNIQIDGVKYSLSAWTKEYEKDGELKS